MTRPHPTLGPDYRAPSRWLRIVELAVCRLRGHRPWFLVAGVWCGRCGKRLG